MPAPNPQVKPQPKAGGIKGKGPMGIPIWGWIAAIVIGLGIAYVFAKKTGAASQDTGNTESSPNPLGGIDSGAGGGVVAPPPPGTSPDTIPGTTGDSGDFTGPHSTPADIIDTLTDPGQTITFNPPTNPLLVADSTFPNAGFATSPYISSAGNIIRGPGGPVIDIDQAISPAPGALNTNVIPSYSSNPNVLPHGQVVD